MKSRIIFALALLLSGFPLRAFSADEKAFVDKYKTAFENKDTATLESFLYTTGSDPQIVEFYKMMMSGEAGSKISKIELVALTPEETKKAGEPQESPDGRKVCLTLKPFKKLVIGIEQKDANGSSSSTSTSFVAEKDGKLVIPVPGQCSPAVAQEAAKKSAPPARTEQSTPAVTASEQSRGGGQPQGQSTVTGMFKGNGKEAKLAYVSAQWREPFADKPSIVLVFTEKDHSKDKKPDLNAGFGRFGSALIVSLHEDGSIFGCEVVHTGLKKSNFSSVGKIKANGFTYANGKVEGELTTGGEDEFFGDTWEVRDLKFVAPLGAIPPQFQPKKSASEEKAESADDESTETESTGNRAAKSVAGPQLSVKDLALTKDATDFEYKALVEQMSFKSPSNVKSVCTELSKNLKAQGWTSDGSDLITAQSSILKRKRGQASLTIFVKPEVGGSEVKIMTEGLSWEGM